MNGKNIYLERKKQFKYCAEVLSDLNKNYKKKSFTLLKTVFF